MAKQLSANAGGPAFPTAAFYDEKQIGVDQGMTLRDYFAGQALAGIVAAYNGERPLPESGTAADCAYCYADAMLARRRE